MCGSPKARMIGKGLQSTDPSNGPEGLSIDIEGPPDSAPKRQRRGRYVSKACGECQRRKIKCDSAPRCHPCFLSGRSCDRQNVDMRSRPNKRRRMPTDEPPAGQSEGSCSSEDDRSTTVYLSERVAKLERLVRLLPGGTQALGMTTDHESSASITSTSSGNTYTVESRSSCPLSRPPTPTYFGETSIRSTLKQVEAHLEEHPRIESDQPSEVASSALSPSPLLKAHVPPREISNICMVLHKYDIIIDKPQWDHFMKIFCDEVHILYPLLNLRDLLERYDLFWHDHITSPLESRQCSRDSCVSLSQILICLAIGQCTASPRVSVQGDRYSAGWSFYSAALELFGDVLDCFEECSNQLLSLQILSLMVIYLFRLDIVSRAEKILALAISHAYHIGLHRSQVDIYSREPSETENSRRVWWCLYILDRRLAIEGGHPFLISDVDINTPLPRISEGVFGDREPESTGHTSSQLEASSDPTPIPYFIAMVEYSKVLGKVWEAVYGAGANIYLNSSVCESLEHLLFGVQDQIPPIFRYHPHTNPNAQAATTPWWLTKQQSLMQIRWLSLRVLIRKPMLQRSMFSTTFELATFENAAMSLRIIKDVIRESMRLPVEQAVFTFPFVHDLLRAVLISLGILIKEPVFKEQYEPMVVQGAFFLETYCQKAWVSGKLTRTVVKLKQIISRLFETTEHRVSHSSEPHTAYQRLGGAAHLRSTEGLRGCDLPSAPDRGEQYPHQEFSTMPLVEAHCSEAENGSSSTHSSCLTGPFVKDFNFEHGTTRQAQADSGSPTSRGTPSAQGTNYNQEDAAEDLDWLYTLFGDYLDPALIVDMR